jgi:hypothetical protein
MLPSMHHGKNAHEGFIKKHPTTTVQYKRAIFRIMEKFQTHPVLDKKKI